MNGLIGKKIGMTQLFDEKGVVLPVTAISIDRNVIVGFKTLERDGYNALILGVDEQKESRLAKPYINQFKNGVKPLSFLKEFKVDKLDGISVGDEYGVEVLESVEFVDVTGFSKGKGFQGVMKRWNFSGGRKSHGSKFHRQNGSTGQNTEPSKGFKGVKRAGRMGNERVTVQSLKVAKIDVEQGVVFLKGAVPGPKRSRILINKAVKRS